MQTDWVAGNSGNWTSPTNWTNGVPRSGDSATIASGRPLMVDQNIKDVQINVTPVGSQHVTLTLNGNDSFDSKTVLNIATANATGTDPATLFFGNQREGGRSGGSFNNHGTINVTGLGAPGGEPVRFDLSGGTTSFLFINSGDMNVTNADAVFRWASAGSGVRPFVTNTGDITVHATARVLYASLDMEGNPANAPQAVRLMNDGTILIDGRFGAEDHTTGSFNVVDGTGTISLQDGTASFVGNVGSGETLNFLNDPAQGVGDNVLDLNGTKASFDATITGFAKGDTINLGAHADTLSYNSITGVLTLSDSSHPGASETLHFAGAYATDNFKLVQNSDGTSSLEYRAAVPPKTTVWFGGSGNVADADNWSHGVPQPGWTALIDDGAPTMTNLAIKGVTIDVGPLASVPASVSFTVNGASSFDKGTTLNILSSPTLVGTSASIFFGNLQSGISGGSFVNSGTINVNPGGFSTGATLNFNLSGGRVPFQLTNAGTINVTSATLSIQWVSAGSGLRPFVVNTGTINVQSTSAETPTLLRAVGGTNQPSDVVGIQNDNAINVQGLQGQPDNTEADFNQVNGTGSISVDNATVSFVGNVSSGQTLKFISDPSTHTADNVLDLNMGKATFGATIQGFGQGDRINLGTTATQSTLSYDANTGVLTIHTQAGSVKLHFAGSYTVSDFQLASNQDGTSAVVANPSAHIPVSDLLSGDSSAVHDAVPVPQTANAGGGAAGGSHVLDVGSGTSLADVLAALHSAANGAFHAGSAS